MLTNGGSTVTDQEIIDQTNDLAGAIFSVSWFPQPTGFEFHKRQHDSDRCRIAWMSACEAQRMLCRIDPDLVLKRMAGGAGGE